MNQEPNRIEVLDCPICKSERRMRYDTWEDCYLCLDSSGAINHVVYPEQLGRDTNRSAGIFNIGKEIG